MRQVGSLSKQIIGCPVVCDLNVFVTISNTGTESLMWEIFKKKCYIDLEKLEQNASR